MAHHYAFTVMEANEQEPKSSIEATHDLRWMEALGLRPFNTTSLRYKLEGEEPKLPRKGRRKPKARRKPTKPKAKPDVARLTLELEGAC